MAFIYGTDNNDTITPSLISSRQTISKEVSSEQIKNWLVNYLANIIDIQVNDIDLKISFDEYGLDSELAIGLTGDLENWLGRKINPILLYNYTNIETLSQKIAEEMHLNK